MDLLLDIPASILAGNSSLSDEDGVDMTLFDGVSTELVDEAASGLTRRFFLLNLASEVLLRDFPFNCLALLGRWSKK